MKRKKIGTEWMNKKYHYIEIRPHQSQPFAIHHLLAHLVSHCFAQHFSISHHYIQKATENTSIPVNNTALCKSIWKFAGRTAIYVRVSVYITLIHYCMFSWLQMWNKLQQFLLVTCTVQCSAWIALALQTRHFQTKFRVYT